MLLAATFAYGVAASLFSAAVIDTLPTFTSDQMRGRVMALCSIGFLGSGPIGGPGLAALWQASELGETSRSPRWSAPQRH